MRFAWIAVVNVGDMKQTLSKNNRNKGVFCGSARLSNKPQIKVH